MTIGILDETSKLPHNLKAQTGNPISRVAETADHVCVSS
jgi:hypothetical protein